MLVKSQCNKIQLTQEISFVKSFKVASPSERKLVLPTQQQQQQQHQDIIITEDQAQRSVLETTIISAVGEVGNNCNEIILTNLNKTSSKQPQQIHHVITVLGANKVKTPPVKTIPQARSISSSGVMTGVQFYLC